MAKTMEITPTTSRLFSIGAGRVGSAADEEAVGDTGVAVVAVGTVSALRRAALRRAPNNTSATITANRENCASVVHGRAHHEEHRQDHRHRRRGGGGDERMRPSQESRAQPRHRSPVHAAFPVTLTRANCVRHLSHRSSKPPHQRDISPLFVISMARRTRPARRGPADQAQTPLAPARPSTLAATVAR